jgi:hypothetical protein
MLSRLVCWVWGHAVNNDAFLLGAPLRPARALDLVRGDARRLQRVRLPCLRPPVPLQEGRDDQFPTID